MNRQPGILVVVHSISSEMTDSSQNQLLAVRSNGQPIDTSQLERPKDRGEFVVGLADATARVLVYRRAGATAVVAIELPERQ